MDYDAGADGLYTSVIVLMDAEANALMEAFAADLEAAIEAAGVRLQAKRRGQQPFHSTLAVVNGTTFPLEEAVAAINQLVPPGSWTGESPLQLTAPNW